MTDEIDLSKMPGTQLGSDMWFELGTPLSDRVATLFHSP